MSKEEFLRNGGFSGTVYDYRWPIFSVGTGVAGFLIGKYGDKAVERWNEGRAKRQAYWNVQAMKEAGLVFIPAGYVQQLGLQPVITPTLPGIPTTEDRMYKMLENIEKLLKDYGERISKLEKTEIKEGD